MPANMPAQNSNYVKLPHSIYRKNAQGKIEEKVEFPEIKPGVYDICNVYSDYDADLITATDKLLNMAVKEIRARGGHITSSDMYIGRWLERHKVRRYVG